MVFSIRYFCNKYKQLTCILDPNKTKFCGFSTIPIVFIYCLILCRCMCSCVEYVSYILYIESCLVFLVKSLNHIYKLYSSDFSTLLTRNSTTLTANYTVARSRHQKQIICLFSQHLRVSFELFYNTAYDIMFIFTPIFIIIS